MINDVTINLSLFLSKATETLFIFYSSFVTPVFKKKKKKCAEGK